MPTLSGSQLITAQIAEPSEGTWTAILTAQMDPLPEGQVDIEIQGIHWIGHVQRAVYNFETASVFVVGGAGGLGAVGTVSDYVQTTVRTVVSSLMSQSGETLSDSSDPTILGGGLVHFHPAASPIGVQLQSALGAAAWRIGRDGELVVLEPGIFVPFEGDEAGLLQQTADAADQSISYSVVRPLIEPGITLAGRDLTYVETVLTPDSLSQVAFT